MTPAELLTDSFARLPAIASRAVAGLDVDRLATQPEPGANTIAWLVWHTARGQDVQIAALADTDEVWTAEGWAARFALPLDDAEMGYGMDASEVEKVRASADLLTGYLQAVTDRTSSYLAELDAAALDRVVDENWSPPVTAGVRLSSILGDCLQHAGQASYVRGLLDRQ
ncbi:mycothiol transferase [Frondihabitans cladoniiphilus]|uniref:DUF664 domain-containing protein n=1 Tax=Frondihabitans cladoniiphilus TaxID=715785 RepID=A0ABP8W2S2_9MICO